MVHEPQDRAFDDAGGSGSTDDSSDFFDEDTDYSTDLPEEEQLAGSTDDSDDDRDDDDDRESFSFQEEGGAAPAPGDEGAPGTDETEGTTSGTSFQEEGGAAPAPPTRESLADEREVVGPSDDQGIEADPDDRHGAITPEEAARARELEAAVLARNPDLRAGDVAVREGGRVELTAAGRVKRATQSLEQRLGIDVDPSEVDVQESGSRYVARYAPENDPNVSGAPNLGTGDRDEALSQIERALEQRVAEARADRMGGPFAQAAAPPQPVDLERGQDYTVTFTEAAGVTGVSAALTPSFVEAETRAAAEAELERRYLGTDLDPGQDIEVTRTETSSGETVYSAELTDQGRIKVAGTPETGETFLDRQVINPAIAAVEGATGVDLPGDEDRSDAVQDVQAYLREQSAIHQAGGGWWGRPGEQVGSVPPGEEDRFPGVIQDIRDVSGEMDRYLAQASDPALAVLGFGKFAESLGEYAYSGAVERAGLGAVGAGAGSVGLPGEQTVREATLEAREQHRAKEATAGETVSREVSEAVALARADPKAALGAAAAYGTLFIAELGGSFFAGRAAGRAARAARGRVRTLGGTQIDLSELAQDPVVRNIETGGVEGRRFPAAEDPGLYTRDPAAAVRVQADRYTPESIRAYYAAADVDEGPILKKALEVEPEGPGTRGFAVEAGGYESPGAFVGPELSPHFLRTGSLRSRHSLRPGLPDMGGRPTGVLVRTDVENPTRSSTLSEFGGELETRAGETTARAKPSPVVTTEEIEAVIPPGARFQRVSSGSRLRDLGARFGIGSEFYTEVGGVRVPLRPVASADDVGGVAGQRASRIADEGAGVGRPLEAYIRPYSRPVDRPLSAPPLSGGASLPSRSELGSEIGSLLSQLRSLSRPRSEAPTSRGGLLSRRRRSMTASETELLSAGDVSGSSSPTSEPTSGLRARLRSRISIGEPSYPLGGPSYRGGGTSSGLDVPEVSRPIGGGTATDLDLELSPRYGRPEGAEDDLPISDDILEPGWINKYAVALAGGGVEERGAPENLEEIAGRRGTFLPLPTEGQVNPDDELAAGLEDVESLFFLDEKGNSAIEELLF